MDHTKVLLTGATGYIGGSVLAQLLGSSITGVQGISISVLVKKKEQVDSFASKGVKPILYDGLEDLDHIRSIASEHDIVIHNADSTNPAAVEALILGLADGRSNGKEKHFIHTSGTSSLGDRPITKELVESREFSDAEGIYDYMKHREAVESYSQRTTDIKVVEVGEQAAIRTYVLKAPIIYGRGTGFYSQQSFHIPLLIRGALAGGQVEYIEEGAGVWDYVHVVDLSRFFELMLAKLLQGESIPSGRKGIYFVRSFRCSWEELAGTVARAGHETGVLATAEPRSISLREAAQKYTGGDERLAEVGLASNSITNSALAREIDWTPKMDKAGFLQCLKEDFQLIVDRESS